jgi:hypothetical protein
VETPRKFITAKLSIRKLGSSSVLMFYRHANLQRTNSTFVQINFDSVDLNINIGLHFTHFDQVNCTLLIKS